MSFFLFYFAISSCIRYLPFLWIFKFLVFISYLIRLFDTCIFHSLSLMSCWFTYLYFITQLIYIWLQIIFFISFVKTFVQCIQHVFPVQYIQNVPLGQNNYVLKNWFRQRGTPPPPQFKCRWIELHWLRY